MLVTLQRATVDDASIIWQMQTDAFAYMSEKYQDYDTNPGFESAVEVRAKLRQPYTYYYFILVGRLAVGAIRVVDYREGGRKCISPLFILEHHRNQGYAQAAICEVERIHGEHNWNLFTVLEERGNCHLYEKMGYQQTGCMKMLSHVMTLVEYAKL